MRSHTAPTALSALVLAAAAAVLLAGCSTPVNTDPYTSPMVPDAPSEAPIETPTGDGSWVPEAYWYDLVEGNRSTTALLVEKWEADDCTVQKAIDGGTGCSTYLSSGALAIEAYHEIFIDFVNLMPGTETGLEGVYSAVESGYPSARAWAEDECNWETTQDCETAGNTILDSIYLMEVGFVAWESTR